MLFTTVEEIKKYISVSVATKIETLRPILEVVGREFMRPVLGAGMYDELQEFYESTLMGPTEPPIDAEVQAAMDELLKLAQAAEIHLVYWYGYDVLNATISESGFHRIESEKQKGLYKSHEDNLKQYFKNAGFNGLDAMLEYLYGDNASIFTEYHDSDTAKAMKLMFIQNTETFNKLYYIGSSRLIFTRMVPFMKIVEDLKLKPVLGTVNYDFIKEEMAKETPDGKVALILPYIQQPLAYFASAMLMQETGADLSDKGLVWEGYRSNTLNNKEGGPSDIKRIENLVSRNNGLGESYMNALRTFLLANAADWNGYASPASAAFNRDNTGKKIFVA